MGTNRLKARTTAGEPSFGGWCVNPSSFIPELLSAEGFDYVCVDCQHGLIDYNEMWPMLQALAGSDATPVVRVLSNDTAWIGKALDAGAEAIIVPMVNSRNDAEHAVAACRYAPEGVRSFGPVRAGLHLGTDPSDVNREVVCLVMIETVAAVEVAGDICATAGLDGVYVGPTDLAISMGLHPATMGDSSEHADAVEEVRAACEANGLIAGIHTTGGVQALSYAEKGFAMCSLATDATLLRTAAREELTIARGGA